MDVRISIRQIGKKKKAIESVPFTLPGQPGSLRGLISAVARACAGDYNARLCAGGSGIRPLSQQALADMEAIGKMAFGMVYSTRPADPDEAAATALQAWEDGLIRVFRGQEELTNPDAPLTVAPGDEFTFLRLVMLTGSLW